jgi:hypothetical protein
MPLIVLRQAADWRHPRAYELDEKERLIFGIVSVEWSI